MNQDTKNEAIEQIDLDIKMGFSNEEEILEGLQEMFFEEESLDEDWLKQAIAGKYATRQKESRLWNYPTDFDKLAAVFDELATKKIVCLHNAGYTKQDGEGDCLDVISALAKHGITAIGYCYYHAQDLARAVDPEIRNLYLGFDSATQKDEEALMIAHSIVAALKGKGFEVTWPGTVDQRIVIKAIDWKKIPDKEYRGSERVIRIMTKQHEEKKPFWKFW